MTTSTRDKRFRPVRLVTVTERERLILTLVRRAGAITRSELIRLTGLPGAAVFRVTEDLASRGLLELGEGVANGPGKPSTLVRLRADALATVGLSVMTDFAEAVMLDFSGEVRAARDVTAPGMNLEEVFCNLQRFRDEEAPRAGLAVDTVFGMGLALAGYFVGPGSRMNPAEPLDDWAMKDLQVIAAERTGLEVSVENIANAAAVGEQLLGVGRRVDSFGYINVAHGLGAGLILNGELVRGRYGNAGEIAALPSMLGGLHKPDLETLRLALAREGVETRNVADLVARYRDDWPGVASWVDWAAPSFSFLASLFRHVLDVDSVVFGGRLPPPLAERIIAAIRWPDAALPQRRGLGLPAPELVPAEVSSRSAAVGAAAIPLRNGYFQ